MAEYSFSARRKQIAGFLSQNGEADVETLAKITGASDATIRRDLLELEKAGIILRTYGGAKIASEESLVARTFGQRDQLQGAAKQAIAAAAAKLVKPGMTVVIDSGTTCRKLASLLADRAPLQVLTSALAVVEALGEVKDIQIIVCGGIFRLANLDFVGSMTDFSNFHADYAFLGCDSILPGRGFFADSLESAKISANMVECANQRIVLADHTKFRQKADYRFLTFAETGTLYTDKGLPAEDFEQLCKDCRVVCC